MEPIELADRFVAAGINAPHAPMYNIQLTLRVDGGEEAWPIVIEELESRDKLVIGMGLKRPNSAERRDACLDVTPSEDRPLQITVLAAALIPLGERWTGSLGRLEIETWLSGVRTTERAQHRGDDHRLRP